MTEETAETRALRQQARGVEGRSVRPDLSGLGAVVRVEEAGVRSRWVFRSREGWLSTPAHCRALGSGVLRLGFDLV